MWKAAEASGAGGSSASPSFQGGSSGTPNLTVLQLGTARLGIFRIHQEGIRFDDGNFDFDFDELII